MTYAPHLIRCIQCGGEFHGYPRKRLCLACYQFQWRTGLARPALEHPVFVRIAAAKRGAWTWAQEVEAWDWLGEEPA